jgi:hypothetical protein|tara:strand:- start:364 stop:735 length:372 start_codon:yes stop_codon:yes gene_type:complete
MIKGFEEYTYELTNYEKELVEKLIKGLSPKIGRSNAVTSTVICKSLNIVGPRLRKLINHIRITNQLAGLCSTSKGYFVAENLGEIDDYIISLKQRIKSQVEVLNSIERQTVLWGGSGQLSLFE